MPYSDRPIESMNSQLPKCRLLDLFSKNPSPDTQKIMILDDLDARLIKIIKARNL